MGGSSNPLKLHFLEIDLTTRCNLHCQHCRTNANSNGVDMPFEMYKRIIDQGVSLGVPFIALSGGEPLLNRDCFRMIRYARQKGIEVHLVTNSTLITKKFAASLAELNNFNPKGRLCLATSLDGKEEVHDSFRGIKGAFSACLTGIRRCVAAGLDVAVISTLHPGNIKQLPDLIDLASNLGCTVLKVRPVLPFGRATEDPSLLLSPEELSAAFKTMVKIKYDQRPSLVLESSDPLWLLADTPLLKGIETHYNIEDGSALGGCSAGIYYLYISVEGWVQPCAYLSIQLGNIRRQTLSSIWYDSPFLEKLRNRNNLEGKCGRCKFKFICGGCRARALALQGDIEQEDPLCKFASKSAQ